MDNINDLINQSVQSLGSTQQSTQEQKPATRLYKVEGGIYTKEELAWKRFNGLYGYTFLSQYGDEPTEEWLMVLAQVEPRQIKKGIDGCIKHHKKFPPNPMQFLELCLPGGVDFGLPGDDAAFSQAVGIGTKKHPAVALTLRNIGDNVFQMRNMPTKAAREIFNAEWVKTVVFVANGGELPDAAIEIEQSKKCRVKKSEAVSLFAGMRDELNFEKPSNEKENPIDKQLRIRTASQELAGRTIIQKQYVGRGSVSNDG